jgi:hypothetical protein
MSISSILGTSQTSSLASMSFKPTTSQTQGVDTDGDHDGDKASTSKIGQFMSKMSDLEKTDPAKAKQVLQTIASKLTDAAGQATGDEAQHLKDLAAKFTQAADTGDLSSIQPPKGGHGHPHGPPPAQASSDASSTDTSATTTTTAAAQASKTEQYKAHGHKPDAQQLAQIFQSAYDSVTSASA